MSGYYIDLQCAKESSVPVQSPKSQLILRDCPEWLLDTVDDTIPRNSLCWKVRQFVQACDRMDRTLLVPRRLMGTPNVAAETGIETHDLYSVYSTVSLAKENFMLGNQDGESARQSHLLFPENLEYENEEAPPSSESHVDDVTITELRTHLEGLGTCLEKLTRAADFLTSRYKNEVNPRAK